jgi:hypothetical protein
VLRGGGGVGFKDGLGDVAVEIGVQSTIVVDPRGELDAREAGGIEIARIRLVALLGDWVLDRQGVCLGGATNGDANHRFVLERGTILILVGVLVEIDN